jgi:hypothetical protein
MEIDAPGEANERRIFYLSRAIEAETRAAEAIDPQMRQTWSKIVQTWRILAEELE